jgi:hypothetical protein
MPRQRDRCSKPVLSAALGSLFSGLCDVQQVVVAVDPDPVGLMAARYAARRWLADGRQVGFARPPLGLDFNDLARAAR